MFESLHSYCACVSAVGHGIDRLCRKKKKKKEKKRKIIPDNKTAEQLVIWKMFSH